MRTITEPSCIAELIRRVNSISGKKISELAEQHNIVIPKSLHRTKGLIGQLIEIALGANAGNKAMPDFTNLGIELKTIPIDQKLCPTESTYVCTAPINQEITKWENSIVYKKLNHVLWVPIEDSQNKPIHERRIGTPFLWKPTIDQMTILQQDWKELTEFLYFGKIEYLTAKHGKYLQIRPKAANSKVLIDYVNEDGILVKTVPKGFYLRALFTKIILQKEFGV